MSRISLFASVIATVLLTTVVVVALTTPHRALADARRTAECHTFSFDGFRTDEGYQEWMNAELAGGRTQFVAISTRDGGATRMCAW